MKLSSININFENKFSNYAFCDAIRCTKGMIINMNIVNKLDLAIKLSEVKTTTGGYLIDGKLKNTYMSNEEWDSFKNAMSPDALAEYSAGGGDELSEKNGRPPKMASYGSSSRLIYTLSRHKDDFHYEKKLSTTIGGTANLDGFYEDEYRYIFVEAKCHEPYSAKSNSVSVAYKKLYNYINACMPDILTIKITSGSKDKYMDVEYFAEGEKLEHFDLKQMVCHLLGIATGMLKGTLAKKQVDFIYLLYDPTELELSADTKEMIDSIYERTCYECNLVDFSTLLRVIFAFLKEEKYSEAIADDEIDALICKFTFTLATQEFYPLLLQ